MASLSKIEEYHLEAVLNMSGGYVLDFSDRTFIQFVYEKIGIDIDEESYRGLSKAKRLRLFWSTQDASVVAKLLEDLLNYAKEIEYQTVADQNSVSKYQAVIQKLAPNGVSTIFVESLGETYQQLESEILDAFKKGRPQTALDRLHTYLIRFFRNQCTQEGLNFSKDDALHSVANTYLKHIIQTRSLHNATKTILNNSRSFWEPLNYVRNNDSLAHDNPVLNNDESEIIILYSLNLLKLIRRSTTGIAT